MPMQMEDPNAVASAPEHDREKMMQRMAEHGMDTDVIDEKVPDHVLAEMVRTCDAKDAEKPVHPMDEDEWEEPDGDEEKMREYRERVKRYGERLKKFAAKYGEKTPDASPDPMTKKGEDMTKMSELIQREVAKALKRDRDGTIGELKRFHEETVAAQKRQAVEAFCEEQAQAGRLAPFQYKPRAQGGPGGPVYERLMRADAREKVITFSEKGKSGTRTELEDQMAEIRRQPTRFGESFRQPLLTAADADAETDKVRRFSEDPIFAAALTAAGKTPADWVREFEEAKKKNPNLTAKQFGVSDLYNA